MDNFSAFAKAEEARRNGNKTKVFDWEKAVSIIKETGATYAEAGLQSDMEYTSGIILEDGKPVREYTYLASIWATPVIVIDGDEIPCWKYSEECSYDAHTKWPTEALDLLKKSE